jgi:hypothetical protein
MVYYNSCKRSYTACCIYNDTLGTGKKAFYSNSNSNLPTSSTKAKVYKGNVVGISVATSGTFSMQCSAILQINKKNLPNLQGEYVEIVPTDSTKFNVFVYNNEHWYRYYFLRKTTVKTIESYEITTMDCWDVSIYNEDSENIMQGNFNFIHSLATPTGHAGYVGVGDGCAVIEWAKFYADGKPFVPGVTTERIKCSEFRYVTKIKQYLSADATKVTDSTPSLDEQGNPIIESYNMMDCIISATGVHGRNRMIIQ